MSDFNKGDRIKVLPHVDEFMQGERYGTVHSVVGRLVEVRLERSGQFRWFFPSAIERCTTTVELTPEALAYVRDLLDVDDDPSVAESCGHSIEAWLAARAAFRAVEA